MKTKTWMPKFRREIFGGKRKPIAAVSFSVIVNTPTRYGSTPFVTCDSRKESFRCLQDHNKMNAEKAKWDMWQPVAPLSVRPCLRGVAAQEGDTHTAIGDHCQWAAARSPVRNTGEDCGHSSGHMGGETIWKKRGTSVVTFK